MSLARILIAGGGTGGHLFPGIALAEELRRRTPGCRIVFVGTERGIEARAVPNAGFELELLRVQGLRGKSFVQRLVGVCRLPLALVHAVRLVRRIRPSVAVSVGGYAAGPAVLAARLLGVPCVVLEQNAVPGTTNRILAHLSRAVVSAMPVRGFAPERVHQLGNPVRASLREVREQPYVPGHPLRVLVFGGSLGARAINDALMAAAPLWKQHGAFSITHQTGEADAARVADAYRAAGVDARVIPFIDDMASAYAHADLVVCRAGATTVAELTVCGRPAVLVPFPFAVDDHQTANAQTLADAGAAVHLPQSALSAAGLVEQVAALAKDPERLRRMAAAARSMGRPDAASSIADLLEAEAAHV